MAKKDLFTIMEDTQEAIVNSSGKFIRQELIKQMTVEQFVDLLNYHNTEIDIRYNPKPKE